MANSSMLLLWTLHCSRWRGASLLRVLLLAGVLTCSSVLRGADEVPREYQVKAVLLLNLVRFVEWPESAFESAEAPLVIGVLGHDDFGPVLDEVVLGETVRSRPIEVRRYLTIDYVRDCHLLFISRSEEERLDRILSVLGSRQVLTVSDAPDFTRAGGIIRMFAKPDGKTGLRINLHAARKANLTLSALLLRVAEIVGVEED